MIPSWGYPPQKRPDPGRYGPAGGTLLLRGIMPRESGKLPHFGTGTVMRSSKTSGSMVEDPRQGFWRALKLSAVALGIGLVMSAGAAPPGGDGGGDDDKDLQKELHD